MGARGFGVDVGGSGIKGALVDLATGRLVEERIKIETPRPATPAAGAAKVAAFVAPAGWNGPVGVTLPSVVTAGVAPTAANIDPSWIGTDARPVLSEAHGGPPLTHLNDADAPGIAEVRFGAGKDVDVVVVLLTFGTGIGSAILHHGVLLPNTELGHMEVDGKEAEHRAASSVKDEKGLSYKEWAAEVTRVLQRYEDLLWPDLFIAGGGISRKHEKWIPRLENRTPIVPAALLNTAGIVGAALASSNDLPDAVETGIAP